MLLCVRSRALGNNRTRITTYFTHHCVRRYAPEEGDGAAAAGEEEAWGLESADDGAAASPSSPVQLRSKSLARPAAPPAVLRP